MGRQKAIAKQIVDKKGDYLLSLKGNQGTLHEDVKLFFEEARSHDFYQKDEARWVLHRYYETREKDHGRIETRRCWMVETEPLDWLWQKAEPWQKAEWTGLSSIGAVESERQVGEKVTRETRCFISSLRGSVKRFAPAVQAHWGIENRSHWALDVALGEGDCGIWQDNAPENLATLRKMALNLLRQDKKSKRGLKARSKRASWDNGYLLRILLQAHDEGKANNY